MKAKQHSGPLVVIGGAEDRKGECLILSRFVELSSRPKPRLLILTVASEFPQEVGEEYIALFKRLGVKEVQALDVRTRDQAASEDLIEAIGESTGVFFTGGDQVRITNLLGGTQVDQILHRRHEDGMVLAGTSAGAAMMSGVMIMEGLSESTPRVNNVKIGPGMEFMHGVIIDQHFGQRGRSGRLLSALAQHPHQLGVGIDENTALIVNGDVFEVIGEGAVTVLDAGSASYNDAMERRNAQHIALCGVTLHVLTAGLGFNLLERRPIVPKPAPGAKRAESNHHEDKLDSSPARAKHIHSSSGSGRTHRAGKPDRA